MLLYENHVSVEGYKKETTNLILTNQRFILEVTKKIGFRKYETSLVENPLTELKYYNEKPQIIQKKDTVALYFINREYIIHFDSFINALKFTNKAIEAATKEGIVSRGAGKAKKAVNLVDDTLGINLTDTIAGVIEKGVAKTFLLGLGKGITSKARLIDAVNNVSTVTDATSIDTDNANSPYPDGEAKTMEQRIAYVKKLKELLDLGAISQEEFDTKKKEILGL